MLTTAFFQRFIRRYSGSVEPKFYGVSARTPAKARIEDIGMIFFQRARTAVACLLSVLVLACLTTSPASAQLDRGDLVVTSANNVSTGPTGNPEPAGSESEVTYTINIKNNSTVTATGVVVTMDIPDDAQFVRCTTAHPSGAPCQQSAGIVTATFATIPAHNPIAQVMLRLKMPAVSQGSTRIIAVLAHAASAIGGEEPRDGNLTITSTVLPPSSSLLMSPSGRTVVVGCGSTVDSTTFGADTEGVLQEVLFCNTGSGLTFSASGKILNLGGKKIFSGQRVRGNAGIIVGPNATNVTIKGGGTQSAKGSIEHFEYCIKDLGGNTSMYVTGLRCFRAKSAGILTLSNEVLIESSLVDNTIPDSKIEVPAGCPGQRFCGGGIGIQAGGNNLHVKDTIVRRSQNVGFWAYGVDATYDGDTGTSRIENNVGIGALLSGGPHQIKKTQVEGGDNAGTSTVGIVVAADARGAILDSVVVKNLPGHAIRVEAGASGTEIKRTSVEDIGGSGFVIDAPTTTAIGLTTIGLYRPSTNTYYLRNSNTYGPADITIAAWGAPGDIPVVGDWDGNGTTTIGLYRPSTNTYYLRNSNTYGAPDITIAAWGAPGDIPVVGDWDGNGTTTIGLYRPSTNTYYLRNSNTYGAPDIAIAAWGAPGDIPVVGDWDGSGTTTIGLYRPSTNTYYLRNSNTYGAPNITIAAWGAPGDIPVVGDWDGNGTTTIGLYRPSTKTYYLRNSNTYGAPDITIAAWGAPNDIPVVGDWTSGSAIGAPSTLNGNSAQLVVGDAFVINSSATLTSNVVENCSGNAFVINAAAFVDSNSAVDNDGYGFVLANTSLGGLGTLRSNTAESNARGGFLVSGNGNLLEGNSAKNNGGRGFDISGSGNMLNTNRGERSAGPEFVIRPNNIDGGSNNADGATFSFTAAGGSFPATP